MGPDMSAMGRAGVVMAILMAGYMLFNAVTAWTDPQGFAARLGLAATSPDSFGWVGVYALRAAFIGLLLAALVLARQWRALFLVAVAALIMPMGDAVLTYSVGSPAYVRHLVIAGIVGLSAALLSQAVKD
jgi:hypothetical protein